MKECAPGILLMAGRTDTSPYDIGGLCLEDVVAIVGD